MERRAIAVHGIVQGVGFRPFVYGLATRLGLGGFIRNQTGGVWIEVEGPCRALDSFLHDLTTCAPPLARIDHVSWEPQAPREDGPFRIEASTDASADAVFFGADVATCDDCLAELFDRADRRYQYPFINCTNCGPRLTIVTGAPYDRERTTMARFRMCAACRAEYDDPTNRRFHAQPTACSHCGPRLQLRAAQSVVNTADPLPQFAQELLGGKVGALKGLGGYHLLCDACSVKAVDELRRRKMRDEKPFAIMVADVATAESLCELQPGERELLTSARRPIVLLQKRTSIPLADSIAPGNPCLGVMLPYTPLHHLLIRAVGSMPLVMTSGNRSDEPIAYEDRDALTRLAGITDLFLVHDRPINVRCDDSVTRIVKGREAPVRRSRGSAPEPIAMPFECSVPILAVGGQLKGTFCLGRGRHAFLSHHLGDLDHYEAYRAFVKDITLYEELFSIQPRVIVHDLHPDYRSTRYALKRSESSGVPTLAVQHHHAHMASCMAEHGLLEPVIGVTFDGAGYGTDGAVWGGDFLVGDYRHFRRAAHLRYVRMPGGEQAIQQPWRMALSYLVDADLSDDVLRSHVSTTAIHATRKLIERDFNAPFTSSTGRLFDCVAALAGVRYQVSYEGQAAVELEWLASRVQADEAYPFDLQEGAVQPEAMQIDLRPAVRAVVRDKERGVEVAVIARRLHSMLDDMIASVCDLIRRQTGLSSVVLSGGTFMNALLRSEVCERLQGQGFQVYSQNSAPTNDGGLSLGQTAIAAVQARCPDVVQGTTGMRSSV